MTSFRRCKVYSSLLQCDLLNSSKKPSGNSAVGNEWLVLVVYFIWKGNISPLKVSANTSVIVQKNLFIIEQNILEKYIHKINAL